MSKTAARSSTLVIAATNTHLHAVQFSAAILDLRLNGTVYKIADITNKKVGPENIGVAAGISFLPALELGI
jgi:hypothetical protein